MLWYAPLDRDAMWGGPPSDVAQGSRGGAGWLGGGEVGAVAPADGAPAKVRNDAMIDKMDETMPSTVPVSSSDFGALEVLPAPAVPRCLPPACRGRAAMAMVTNAAANKPMLSHPDHPRWRSACVSLSTRVAIKRIAATARTRYRYPRRRRPMARIGVRICPSSSSFRCQVMDSEGLLASGIDQGRGELVTALGRDVEVGVRIRCGNRLAVRGVGGAAQVFAGGVGDGGIEAAGRYRPDVYVSVGVRCGDVVTQGREGEAIDAPAARVGQRLLELVAGEAPYVHAAAAVRCG